MPHILGQVKVSIFFFKPESKTEEWVKSDLWKKAEAIPGAQVRIDNVGMEATLFGARTSGQTFLFDKGGDLIFSGGITPERGHMGDSRGRDSILAFFRTGTTEIPSTPVYGCSIRNPERAPAGDLE
jgi:hypothetical protein